MILPSLESLVVFSLVLPPQNRDLPQTRRPSLFARRPDDGPEPPGPASGPQLQRFFGCLALVQGAATARLGKPRARDSRVCGGRFKQAVWSGPGSSRPESLKEATTVSAYLCINFFVDKNQMWEIRAVAVFAHNSDVYVCIYE